MSGLICALDVRVSYVDADGVPTGGVIGIVNPVKLAINTPEPDRQQRISKMRDSYGQALDELVTPKPTEIELSTDDTGDAEVLAWATNGSPVDFNQAAATVTDQALAVVKGEWVKLPHVKVSTVVIENTGGTTTYVEGTDYLLDTISGNIKITQGGAIASGNVQVSYQAAAVTGKTVEVGTRPNITVRIEGEGKNLATAKPLRVLVRRTSLSASGALDLMGSEFVVTELKGTALKVGSYAPAEITTLDAA